MRIALSDIPERFKVLPRGRAVRIAYGEPPVWVTAQRDGDDVLLFPERSHLHDDLAVALGLKV